MSNWVPHTKVQTIGSGTGLSYMLLRVIEHRAGLEFIEDEKALYAFLIGLALSYIMPERTFKMPTARKANG